MTDDTEFGPWQIHDGKGCPCVGQMVHMVFESVEDQVGVACAGPGYSWDWSWSGKLAPGTNFTVDPIIRYRIKKPRALLDLIQLIADLPAPTQPMKTDGVIA